MARLKGDLKMVEIDIKMFRVDWKIVEGGRKILRVDLKIEINMARIMVDTKMVKNDMILRVDWKIISDWYGENNGWFRDGKR